MYHDASLWVDAWQCARTYGVQRPGKTSGAYNRSLCRSTPVCPSVGHRDARLSDDWPRLGSAGVFAVLLALGGRLVLLVPRRAAGSARAIPPGLSRAPVTGCVAAAGMGDRHGAVPPQGSRCRPVRTRSGGSGDVPAVD